MYAILKQKPYNLITNTVKAYLSAQSSSLSGFVISKTHISSRLFKHPVFLFEWLCDQQDSYKWPKATRKTALCKSGRQRKCHFSYSSFFLSFFIQPSIFQQRYLENGSSHFSMKLMLITVWSSTTTQRLHRLNSPQLVNKSHSQQSEAAVHCLGRHFLILYTCAHEVSFPDQRPRSLVWKWTSTQVKQPVGSTHSWHGLSPRGRLMNTTQVRHCIQLPTCSYTNNRLLTASVNYGQLSV